jgi:hypothetical protein
VDCFDSAKAAPIVERTHKKSKNLHPAREVYVRMGAKLASTDLKVSRTRLAKYNACNPSATIYFLGTSD